MAARLSIFQKGLVVILSPILLESGLVFSLYSVLSQLDKQQTVEARQKARAASVIKMSSLDFEACMLLFAMGMPGAHIPRDLFDEKMSEVRAQTAKSVDSMSDDANLKPIYGPLHENQKKFIRFLEDLLDPVSNGSTSLVPQVEESIVGIVSMLDDTSSNIEEFTLYNNLRLDESRTKIAELRKKHFQILLASASGSCILSALLMFYFYQSIIKRLAIIQKNSILLGAGKALAPPLGGTDEISMLDKSLHLMQQGLSETRRKELLFFNNAADVIFILDRDDKFVRLNPATKENWGLDPDFLVGRSVEQILSQDTRLDTLEFLRNCRQTGKPASFENKVLRDSTAEAEYSWEVYLEPEESRLYCMAHDISAQKELERARERFIAIVSHDLKEPIHSIFESFELVRAVKELPEKARSKVETVRENLQRLLKLVDELVRHRSFPSDKDKLELGTTGLSDLFKRAAGEAEGIARAKNVVIIPQETSCFLECDRNRLIQVLLNLLSNAVKFSPEGAEIHLRAREEGESIEISVDDSGRGIPEDKLHLIFEKFQQVDQADGKRSVGTGLGLPICKQIVELHGGSISVQSVVGKGTSFRIRLPKVGKENSVNETKIAADSGIDVLEQSGLPRKSDAEEKKTLPLRLKGAVLICLPLAFELLFAGTLTYFFVQSENLAKKEVLDRQIADETNDITFCYRRMAIALLAQKKGANETYSRNRKQVIELARSLRNLVKDDPQRKEKVARIIEQVKICNATIGRAFIAKQRRAGEGIYETNYLIMPTTLVLLRPLSVLTHELQDLVVDASRRGAANPARQRDLRQVQVNLLAAGFVSNLILGLFLASVFSNDIRRRLVVIAQNTVSFSRDDLLARPLGGSDEIAQLDSAFHRVAADLRAARKRERTLFDNSREVICSIDSSGRISGINPTAAKLWGYEKDELLGREFLSIVSESDRQLASKMLSVDSREEPASMNLESRIVRSDDSLSEVLLSVTQAGNQQELFCVAHDISKRKEADRLRNEFLSMITHDLRTPLSGVMVITVMLQDGGYGSLPDEAVKVLALVNSDVERLMELINDLLDIEKIEAGMMSFSLEAQDMKSLAEEFARMNSQLISSKEIELALDVESATVSTDKDRFLQVLSNLLRNSVNRSSPGAKIDFLLSRNLECCTIIIRDYATPLNADLASTAFDRFALQGVSPVHGSGSRLALPLSRSIIKALGGSVELRQSANAGNEFSLVMNTSADPDQSS